MLLLMLLPPMLEVIEEVVALRCRSRCSEAKCSSLALSLRAERKAL